MMKKYNFSRVRDIVFTLIAIGFEKFRYLLENVFLLSDKRGAMPLRIVLGEKIPLGLLRWVWVVLR